MEYLVVSFKSRQETIKVSKIFNSINISCSVINTPKEAGLGCGLSVKTSFSYLYAVKSALSRLNVKSFIGLFKVINVSGKNIVKSIY